MHELFPDQIVVTPLGHLAKVVSHYLDDKYNMEYVSSAPRYYKQLVLSHRLVSPGYAHEVYRKFEYAALERTHGNAKK